MLIAVVGGKLQGVEAVYLAQKAGWETVVIDKNPHALATQLCSRFIEFEFSIEYPIPPSCPEVDIILPALEDIDVLTAIKIWAQKENTPFIFDLDAYKISNSKLASNAIFKKMNLLVPLSWPVCSFPVVVKPDQASGSMGVEVLQDEKALNSKISTEHLKKNLVIQEYIEGPSFSIEIIGQPGNYQVLEITDLYMDKTYDCKRVTAPTQLGLYQTSRFKKMALAIAKKIHFTGIMDVEVVLNNNELKLLEIDVRLPSQTPVTVYWSTGINMVEMLGNLFTGKNVKKIVPECGRFVALEHIRVSNAGLEICGEHIMTWDGPLTLRHDFFGAKEALTSFVPGKKLWVATMIYTGDTHGDVSANRHNSFKKIIVSTNIIGDKID